MGRKKYHADSWLPSRRLIQAETQEQDNHRHKGFSLLTEEDAALFGLLLCGEFVIHGFSNQALRAQLTAKNPGQITRLLKRLRVHDLIKRPAKRYRYYLTDFGYQVAALALKLGWSSSLQRIDLTRTG